MSLPSLPDAHQRVEPIELREDGVERRRSRAASSAVHAVRRSSEPIGEPRALDEAAAGHIGRAVRQAVTATNAIRNVASVMLAHDGHSHSYRCRPGFSRTVTVRLKADATYMLVLHAVGICTCARVTTALRFAPAAA